MKIIRLRVNNFRGFKFVDCDFDEQFNLIVGENGSGKSSLLEALAVAAGSFLLGIRGCDSRHIRGDDIRTELSAVAENPVQVQQYPVSVQACGRIADEPTLLKESDVTWKREISGKGGKTTRKDAKSLSEKAEKLARLVQEDRKVDLPLIAYYGAGRLWVPTKDIQGEKTKATDLVNPARLDAYKFCIDPRIKFTEVFEWLANEKYIAIEQGAENNSFQVVKQAMHQCVEGCEWIDYSVKSKDLLAKFAERDALPFSLLSDGQKSMLAVIADIAIKASILNPHLGGNILRETQGIVLIDEIDLHLHPKWQRQAVRKLKKIFPKIQFFATTHSPQVIGETPKEQIMVLRQDGSWFRPEASRGLNSNEVLRDVMGANYVSLEFRQKIAEVDHLLQDGAFEEASKQLDALQEDFPNVPEFDRIDAYMSRMDALAEEED